MPASVSRHESLVLVSVMPHLRDAGAPLESSRGADLLVRHVAASGGCSGNAICRRINAHLLK